MTWSDLFMALQAVAMLHRRFDLAQDLDQYVVGYADMPLDWPSVEGAVFDRMAIKNGHREFTPDMAAPTPNLEEVV